MILGLNAALDLLLPASCAGCGAPGSPCCPACQGVFASPEPVARSVLMAVPAYALAPYQATARRLVLAFKENGRRDLAQVLGGSLAAALLRLPTAASGMAGMSTGETLWLVPVPSRRSAARVRGGQHLASLAMHCAKALAASGRPAAVAPALRLASGVRDAVGLDYRHRVLNLFGRVRVNYAGLPPVRALVILLDDVITTGATIAACAQTLKSAGVRVSTVLTLTATN